MAITITTFSDRNQAEDVDYTPSGGASTLATMTYDAGMRELGNGLEEDREYRDDNLLDTLTVETGPGNDDRPDLSFAYGYDANKNLDTEDRGAPGSSADDFSFSRTVDAKDWLTNWLRGNGDT